jgi:hypothetical protein
MLQIDIAFSLHPWVAMPTSVVAKARHPPYYYFGRTKLGMAMLPVTND